MKKKPSKGKTPEERRLLIMKRFIGTKAINAKPMTRLEYNCFRGWVLPEDENGEDEGYLVEYLDGGVANTKEYAGYVSWSPKAVFENSYTNTDGLTKADLVEEFKAMLSVWGIS